MMKSIMGKGSFLVLFSGMIIAGSCGVSRKGIRGNETASLKTFSVTMGAQSNTSTGGLLDLSKGKVMSLREASGKQKDVDIIYTYGRTTKVNLFVPGSDRAILFGKDFRDMVYSWSVFTQGLLVDLGNGKGAQKLYQEAKNRLQLIEAYDQATKTVKLYSDYKVSENGPAKGLRKVETGDIIMFKSPEKGIYAIAKVTGYDAGYSGHISLDFKVSAM